MGIPIGAAVDETRRYCRLCRLDSPHSVIIAPSAVSAGIGRCAGCGDVHSIAKSPTKAERRQADLYEPWTEGSYKPVVRKKGKWKWAEALGAAAELEEALERFDTMEDIDMADPTVREAITALIDARFEQLAEEKGYVRKDQLGQAFAELIGADGSRRSTKPRQRRIARPAVASAASNVCTADESCAKRNWHKDGCPKKKGAPAAA